MATRDFDRTVSRALSSTFLQKALNRATDSFKGMRAAAEAEFPDFQELREQARQAKDRALLHLDQVLPELEQNVIQAGGQVFWAENAREAIRYIRNLALEKGVRTVVKGKSMTTEEMELNPALIASGIDVMETDLGEYIIQLAGERPSHIIGPAIHKTKEEVARLFEEKIGLAYTEDPEELTRAARKRLRASFLAADMGITGANFAVAETGALVLLENEGNIRMCTTLPRIHVAVMGLEKAICDLKDLAVLLQILPLAAVGQRLPSYVSVVTGPGRREGVGPEEFHLVLLDGFRSQVLGDPDFRQILRCLRCGACLNFCPVYHRIGGHSYPWVYSGPVGVILTAAALGPEAASDVAGACTQCKACDEACPVKIELSGLILKIRKKLAAGGQAAQALTLLARGLALPAGYDTLTRLFGPGVRMLSDGQGKLVRGPKKWIDFGKDRMAPQPAAQPFHRSRPGKKRS